MAQRRLFLTLFSSANCSLCEVAKETTKRVQAIVPFELDEIDIHQPENERWKKYKYYTLMGNLASNTDGRRRV